jgi:arginase
MKRDDGVLRLAPGGVAVLEVPFDGNSSFMTGPAEAPSKILEALHSSSSNLCCETGLDLGADNRWAPVGEVQVDRRSFVEDVETAAASLLATSLRVLALGGDHSITYPLLRAHAGVHQSLTVVHLDAHPDLYDELDGNRLSHACPFARVMEEKLVGRLVQIGVRTATTHQRAQAERFGVEMIEMRNWTDEATLPNGPCYVSLDLDVLDPAFAPGVSHYEPGGMSVRQVLDIIQRLPGPIAAADIVEYNPSRDPSGVTAMVAAKCLKELLGRMVG